MELQERIYTFPAHFRASIDRIYVTASDTTRAEINEYFDLGVSLPIIRPEIRIQRAILNEISQIVLHRQLEPEMDPIIQGKFHRYKSIEMKLLALVRHHGLPVPALYWTFSPLAALWFASANLPCKGARPTIWSLNSNTLDTARKSVHRLREVDAVKRVFEEVKSKRIEQADLLDYLSNIHHFNWLCEIGRITLARPFLPENRRIIMQSGCLMHTPIPEPLDSLISRCPFPNIDLVMTKNIILQDHGKILADLDRLGISGSSLFPEPDGTVQQETAMLKLSQRVNFSNTQGMEGFS
jgi:hypothetical protein